ncbi:MAG: UDP-2,3-diacylglucosamine diphosphatase, partial [Halothiobacillus sp.]
DFLIGQEFLDRIKATPLPDVCSVSHYSQSLVLCHGDTLCTDDAAYQAMRQQLGSPVFSCDFLSKPLDERLAIAMSLRARSRTESSSKPEDIMDVNPAAVRALLKAQDACILLHGHTHRPAIHREAPGISRIVTGDWGEQGWLMAVSSEKITLERFNAKTSEIVDTLDFKPHHPLRTAP